MTRRRPSLPAELEAFIEPRRVTRQVPGEMRARVLARAGKPAATGAQLPAAYSPHRGDSAAPIRARLTVRLAVAASVALAAGTVWGIVALPRQPDHQVGPGVHPNSGTANSGPRRTVPVGEVERGPAATMPPAEPANPAAPTGSSALFAPLPEAAVHAHGPRVTAPRDAFAVELALLQRAHTDYTHRDLTGALALLAEHARRFPHGRLAEEREALRVRSLLAAGRTAEAHRVAATFATDFPRSALLQRLDGEESPRP